MSQNHKLIVSLTSPYARKVRITAAEKNIAFDMIVDVPWNEDTGVTKINPLGKVPVWISEDGESIYDSKVIVEFLESLSGPELFPANIKSKIYVKQIEALADGIMDASLCIFAERKKRPKELQYEWWVERQFGKIFRGLEELSAKLSKRNYFYKNELTIADIAAASALGYVGLRFSEDFDWMKKSQFYFYRSFKS